LLLTLEYAKGSVIIREKLWALLFDKNDRYLHIIVELICSLLYKMRPLVIALADT
jgi:hypothetical protein